MIKDPTNLEPNKSQTCIDLIFASQPNLIIDSGVHPSLFQTCHHQVIFAKINLKFYLPPPYNREVWSYNHAKVEQINRAISSFDWHRALSPLDVNKQVELFNEIILNIFRNFIPNKIVKHSSKDSPWISKEIKTSLRKKARLYKKFLRNSSNIDDQNNLINHSKECSDLISSSKKLYFNNLSNKLNSPHLGPKTYWSILNGILGKIKIPVIPPLLVNQNFETNFLTKANIFNEYFSSQCNLIANSSTLPDLYFKTENRLNNITFNNDSIQKIIQNLNPAKAHGWDGISIKMIKMCEQTITTPLFIIFNNAILNRYLP